MPAALVHEKKITSYGAEALVVPAWRPTGPATASLLLAGTFMDLCGKDNRHGMLGASCTNV
jgi:hypothetical protein